MLCYTDPEIQLKRQLIESSLSHFQNERLIQAKNGRASNRFQLERIDMQLAFYRKELEDFDSQHRDEPKEPSEELGAEDYNIVRSMIKKHFKESYDPFFFYFENGKLRRPVLPPRRKGDNELNLKPISKF